MTANQLSKQKQKWQIISELNKFYHKLSPDNLELGDEGQSLQQFLSMKGIQPNQQGTGRVSFKDVKNFECIYILSQTKAKDNRKRFQGFKRKILQFLKTFFQKPANFNEQNLSFEKGSIIDRNKNLQYSLKRSKQRFNALQLLDLLNQYKSQSSVLIGFIQNGLHQNNSDVYGRACGNGVAIIDLTLLTSTEENSRSIFYQTLLHETLHTFGFDHCLQSSCLMNPLLAGDLWLCPTCLKKLDSQIELNLIEWVSKLKGLYEKQLKQNKKLISKSAKILQYIKSKIS